MLQFQIDFLENIVDFNSNSPKSLTINNGTEKKLSSKRTWHGPFMVQQETC